MNLSKLTLLASALLLALAVPSMAKDKDSMVILEGPTNAPLGKVASIEVPVGHIFLDGKTTRMMMESSGEPVSGRELGFLSNTNEDWAVYFEFNDIGYVKDDDKDKLDADKLLASIKKGTEAANKERVRAGHAPLIIVGWEVPPKYDEASHNLEWAIRATSEGQPILNYNTRILGRKGVMEAVLVVSPDQLAATMPAFRNLLKGYSYQTGQTYAEYRPGDKMAKIGLGALVVGGAAVGAAKLGLFAWLAVIFKKAWKLVVIAFAAVAAFFKKLFTGRSKSRGVAPE